MNATQTKCVRRVKKVLDDMEQRGCENFELLGWATNKIAWLWKWRKISREEMVKMTAQVRYILGSLSPDQEDAYLKGGL